MKRSFLFSFAVLLLLAVAGYFWIRHRKHEMETRMRADLQQLQQEMKKETETQPIDFRELHAGDTALVAACTKSFFVSGERILEIHTGATLPEDYIKINRMEDGRFELRFSCASIKNAYGIYPLVFTTVSGQDITIYFTPLPDLDGQLKYYSNFKIQ